MDEWTDVHTDKWVDVHMLVDNVIIRGFLYTTDCGWWVSSHQAAMLRALNSIVSPGSDQGPCTVPEFGVRIIVETITYKSSKYLNSFTISPSPYTTDLPKENSEGRR